MPWQAVRSGRKEVAQVHPLKPKRLEATNCTVFVVDDHDRLRKLIVNLVNSMPAFSVAGEAGSAEAALQDSRIDLADIVLTDLSMSGMNGVELSKKLLDKNEQQRIVLLTAHDDQFYADAAFRVGVAAFIVKDDPNLIEQALLRVNAGERNIMLRES